MRLMLALSVLCLTAACSTQPNIETSPAAGDSWQLIGKLGIRSPGYNGSVGINWHQEPGNRYTVDLSGALGLSIARIEGTGESLVLSRTDKRGQRLSRADLEDYLGYRLPVNHLAHWVRGFPDPAYKAKHGEKGFSQAGWLVEYVDVRDDGPRRIKMSLGATTLTLLIRRWVW
jgi:outer membrane lipoprotein LolB